VNEALIGSGLVLVDLDDGVAHVRLNRPEASNGMNVPFLRALYEALMRVHGEPRTRAVLLSGEGPHFCAGGDVHTFAAQGEALPDYLREATTWLGSCASALMRLEAPVVTAVHGYAAGGGGFGLVCASDLVVAGESAKFLLGATRVGMAPDAGGSVTLARIVGLRKAMEIAMLNPTLSAAQAAELGIVNRVVPDDAVLDEGRALARQPASWPTARRGPWPPRSVCCGTGWAPPSRRACPTSPARCPSCPARPTPVRGWRRSSRSAARSSRGDERGQFLLWRRFLARHLAGGAAAR
jgi:2-(1,2-epoxy-1,2-dihydrophenyl)acetyl-CoA isomerase